MTYFELIHQPTRNLLADFDTAEEALQFVRETMISPDLDGLQLVLVRPGSRELIATGASLLRQADLKIQKSSNAAERASGPRVIVINADISNAALSPDLIIVPSGRGLANPERTSGPPTHSLKAAV